MLLVISKPQEHTEQDVLWVECQTTEGAIIIQPGHAPFVALLKSNSSITVGLDESRTESIALADGYLMVERDRVLIVTM